ncbi:MAG TPA: helix-turn-helix domain-containing protein [Solirubrobacteraceae bacterium]|nr:helix-turn-helix domain-containing protein [Solirubrobacteraceae bacterium]
MSELLDPDRPMRADARRNHARILQAARELFAGEQPEVQIDEIARGAGVGVGTVYRHFPDKEALMGELVRQRFCLFNVRLGEAVADQVSSPFEALADALRAHAAWMAEDAATRFAFMSGGERVFAYAASEMEEFMRLSSLLVERAKAAGQLMDEFDAEDIPMFMCGVCAAIDKRHAGWDWRRHLELILRGMRTPA